MNESIPQSGGSYTRDEQTGELIPVTQTQPQTEPATQPADPAQAEKEQAK